MFLVFENHNAWMILIIAIFVFIIGVKTHKRQMNTIDQIGGYSTGNIMNTLFEPPCECILIP
jgi:vacuolar-type H+-ATPase subunit I/STV1